jgi:hypothetical protein
MNLLPDERPCGQAMDIERVRYDFAKALPGHVDEVTRRLTQEGLNHPILAQGES